MNQNVERQRTAPREQETLEKTPLQLFKPEWSDSSLSPSLSSQDTAHEQTRSAYGGLGGIMRKAAPGVQDDVVIAQHPLQAKGGVEGGDEVRPATGGGSSLPGPVLEKMEGAFGASFADVKVHQDGQAEKLGALAYTQGNNIHFASGQYQPESQSGQELIGHELAHVVQQSEGRVSAPAQSKGAPINADPGLEAEADALGAKAARGEPVRGEAVQKKADLASGEAAVQRKGGMDHETWNRMHSTANAYVSEVYSHLQAVGLQMALCYKDAYQNVKDTLDAASARQQFTASLLAGLFGAALGGIGGVALKGFFTSTITSNDYIVDGVVDLAKQGLNSTIGAVAGVSALPGVTQDPLSYHLQAQQRILKEQSNCSKILVQMGLHPNYDINPYTTVVNTLKVGGKDPMSISVDSNKITEEFEKKLWQEWVSKNGKHLNPSRAYWSMGQNAYEYDVPKEVAERLSKLGISEATAKKWAGL